MADDEIKTNGGAYAKGDVNAGRDFVGRDKVDAKTITVSGHIVVAVVAIVIVGLISLTVIIKPAIELTPISTANAPVLLAKTLATPTGVAPNVVTANVIPMSTTGYNVAIAGFVEQDAASRTMYTPASQAISEWLYRAIENETKLLPASLSYAVRGPDEIGPVHGATPADRAGAAAQIAVDYHATLVIYGVVTANQSGYIVVPEFFVSEQGFQYGSEIIGADRLGRAVPFNLPLTPETLLSVNGQLNVRATVLRHFVAGLAYYYISNFDEAEFRFRQALALPDWLQGQGQEVIYVLMGGAQLGAYNRYTNPTPLSAARASFEAAYLLNTSYARALLGLGAVNLQEAAIHNATGTEIGSVDEIHLLAATQWYSASLTAADRQAAYFVEIKAAYGLGQAHLLGSEFGIHNFSREQAAHFFQQVIAQGEPFSMETLAWYVGSAHGYLGRIAGREQDYATMSTEYGKANTILETLPYQHPLDTIARNWANIAYAEAQQGHTDAALQAYRTAVHIGKDAGKLNELNNWQAAIVELERKGP